MRFDRIRASAATHIFPRGFACDSGLAGGISRASLGRARRIHSSSLACIPFFARSESRGTGYARCARVACLDFRLVSPHRRERQRAFLLFNFCPARLSNRPATLSKQLATERRTQASPALLDRENAPEKRPIALQYETEILG